MLKIPRFTRRAVLYVGHACNAKCVFCYYATNGGRKWRSLRECRHHVELLRHKYNNRFVDITGGEPTIYPDILSLVSYCREVDLKPTVITNMLVLDDTEKVSAFKDAGIEDFLCSIHGLNQQHDEITGVAGSFTKVVRALRNFSILSIPFRVNCVINTLNFRDLKAIAEYVFHNGSSVINYIFCNIFEWQRSLLQFQPKFSDIQPYLDEALSYCDENNIRATVRYVPFCFMQGHEGKCCNFVQLPYDFYEWDCKSWMSQDSTSVDVLKVDESAYRTLSNEAAYRLLTNRLSQPNYTHPPVCADCRFVNICDGLNNYYIQHYGSNEIVSQPGQVIREPDYFWRMRNV